MAHEDNFLTQLIEEDDITWQSMIQELVKNEEMDPWDVDISLLTERFLAMIQEFKETNLRISGKVVLAAAMMLRLKSGRFIDFDLIQLEHLMQDDYDDDFEDFEGGVINRLEKANPDDFKLYPRTPQPRKRKVSLVDLMGALEKVLESDKRKAKNRVVVSAKTPEVNMKHMDINLVIQDVMKRLDNHCDTHKTSQLKFSQIIPSDKKEDLISTFIPLLHLTNQRVTDLHQEEAFADFDIFMLQK
ncbi:MAG: segregation/condensation protein A [Candidatus Woesearchaeota archaeon]